jgi:predicted AAA+ superfamily ATPase
MIYFKELVKESLGFFPAVLLLGARQIGKSTLAKALVSEGFLDEYLTLDDFTTLASFKADPDGALAVLKHRVVLDEIQRVPDLMRALKKNIDENRQKGRFLLTGSANVLFHREVTESLTGRLDILVLEGLGVSDLQNTMPPQGLKILLQESRETFKTHLLKQQSDARIQGFDSEDLWDAIFFGGYPEVALSQNARFKERYFQAYQTTYIEKDVRDLSKGIDIVQFSQVAKMVLLNSGGLTNVASMSKELQIDQRTIKRYLELMEFTFQSITLLPWPRNVLKKIIKTPKIYAKDSGVMTFMHRISSPAEIPNSRYFGLSLETYFFMELRKQLQMIPGASVYFYRTHAGKEVDFVVEYGQKLIGIELKCSSAVQQKDFSGLVDLEEANQGKLELGIVLYQGKDIRFFSENKVAVPLKYLFY